VVLGAFVSVVPIALCSGAVLAVVHLPTFAALLEPSAELSCRVRDGQRVSPIAIAAVVGGLVSSVGLMLIPSTMVLMDGGCAWIYGFTWAVLPIFGLAGSALAAGLMAALVGLAWLVRRWSRAVSACSGAGGGRLT
jgi:hypothetical protein